MLLFILNIFNATLPITDPVLKFLIVLAIILAAPLLLNKIKIPYLIGLIIAGAVIGPNGFNIVERDSSIVVTGTTGLLYIMFLAGLEIDLAEFKKNKWKSIGFGIYTFAVPLGAGLLIAHYILHYNWLTSFLFASLFSTHTLISYPLLGKLGVVKNRVVNITIGGTMITDVLALLILAIVVGITQGEVNTAFWIKLFISFTIFGVLVLFGFPILGRWFFKNVNDKISQYIFVLVVIYLAAMLAELAGMEAIIGAFFAGLALNRLIPNTSALMNRIDFVGNAIFIPLFLLSVGMLIDLKVFFKDFETIQVVILMTIAGIFSKYIAAYFTQKSFGYTKAERGLIFGLSTSHAAAILAVVMVGYNIIMGENEAGEPIRLLNESVLNGSIVLILVSCTLSSFVTQKNGRKIMETDNENTMSETHPDDEKILLAINYETTVEPLINLALLLKSKTNNEHIFAINIINKKQNESSEKNAKKILETVEKIGASADIKINARNRFDSDVRAGIANVIQEDKITDLLLGVNPAKGFTPSFTFNLYNGHLKNQNTNIFVYREVQPISTIVRHLVVLPENIQHESGFFYALGKIWNISRNSGATIAFYGKEDVIHLLKKIKNKVNIEADFNIVKTEEPIASIRNHIKINEALILMMYRNNLSSSGFQITEIPNEMNGILSDINCLLMYPFSSTDDINYAERNVNNPDEFAEIGKIIGRIFK
jgi:Kef-type K+ transport system membrane component KefB